VDVRAQAQAQVDVEQYLKRDGYGRIKISPDGRYYAATVDVEGRGGLVILRRSDKKVVAGSAGVKDSVVDKFWWAKDDVVVLSMAQRFGSRDQPYPTGQLFAMSIDGSRIRTLVGPKPQVGLVETYGGMADWEMASLIDTLPSDANHVLISTWKASVTPITQVEKLDVYTGRRSRVASAPVRRASFVTDVAGRVRFVEGARDDNYRKLYYRERDDSEWQLINDEAQSGRYESALGFSADGVIAYLQVTQENGPDAVVAWNTRTGERKQVQRDATVDPFETIYDRDARTLIGMQYMADKMQTRLFDDAGDTARIYRALGRAFPGSAVTITSYTSDGRLALVQVWDDRTPGDTYLFDTQAMTASGVFVGREWFDPTKLPAARAVTVKARDGHTLHGYLTPPRGPAATGPVPMVVMPHGGPFGIFDTRSFHDDTHLLAEAGYAVLRVNFRGSGNYGASFRHAGAREWGGRMQDDITDATRWAIEQGIADPSRICIYGASYGGYAALMGVAREPDLYRCAVGYVGVYDLELMHREDSRTAGWLRTWANDWLGERDMLDSRSPTLMADRIKVPVFLAAGGQDRIAPLAHSKKMERALRSAGKPVETLYFSSEGHGFYTDEHKREYYTRLLDFLARHLGGARGASAKMAK
jgi:dipeptidyl aminopeptidase/acylaminoacyl peptidase